MSPSQEEQCARNEREIHSLREKAHQHSNQITGLTHDVESVQERIPPDLREWMGAVKVQLQGLNTNVENIHQALQRGYVTVMEFTALRDDLRELCEQQSAYARKDDLEPVKAELAHLVRKEELEPIKLGFYRVVAVFGSAVIVALLGLLFKGAGQ